jgi:hypothetical protein
MSFRLIKKYPQLLRMYYDKKLFHFKDIQESLSHVSQFHKYFDYMFIDATFSGCNASAKWQQP